MQLLLRNFSWLVLVVIVLVEHFDGGSSASLNSDDCYHHDEKSHTDSHRLILNRGITTSNGAVKEKVFQKISTHVLGHGKSKHEHNINRFHEIVSHPDGHLRHEHRLHHEHVIRHRAPILKHRVRAMRRSVKTTTPRTTTYEVHEENSDIPTTPRPYIQNGFVEPSEKAGNQKDDKQVEVSSTSIVFPKVNSFSEDANISKAVDVDQTTTKNSTETPLSNQVTPKSSLKPDNEFSSAREEHSELDADKAKDVVNIMKQIIQELIRINDTQTASALRSLPFLKTGNDSTVSTDLGATEKSLDNISPIETLTSAEVNNAGVEGTTGFITTSEIATERNDFKIDTEVTALNTGTAEPFFRDLAADESITTQIFAETQTDIGKENESDGVTTEKTQKDVTSAETVTTEETTVHDGPTASNVMDSTEGKALLFQGRSAEDVSTNENNVTSNDSLSEKGRSASEEIVPVQESTTKTAAQKFHEEHELGHLFFQDLPEKESLFEMIHEITSERSNELVTASQSVRGGKAEDALIENKSNSSKLALEKGEKLNNEQEGHEETTIRSAQPFSLVTDSLKATDGITERASIVPQTAISTDSKPTANAVDAKTIENSAPKVSFVTETTPTRFIIPLDFFSKNEKTAEKITQTENPISTEAVPVKEDETKTDDESGTELPMETIQETPLPQNSRSNVLTAEEKTEEKLSPENVIQIIPVVIEDLRKNTATAEDKRILAGVYGDLWPNILEMAERSDAPIEQDPTKILNKLQPSVRRRRFTHGNQAADVEPYPVNDEGLTYFKDVDEEDHVYVEAIADYLEKSPIEHSYEYDDKWTDNQSVGELMTVANAHVNARVRKLPHKPAA